jgi:archaellum component FlaC
MMIQILVDEVKEIISLNENVNKKITELSDQTRRFKMQIDDLKKEFEDERKRKQQIDEKVNIFEANMEKFVSLYEAVTNMYNPFVKNAENDEKKSNASNYSLKSSNSNQNEVISESKPQESINNSVLPSQPASSLSPAPSVPPASANPAPQSASNPSPAPSVPPASANPTPQPVSSPSSAPSVPPASANPAPQPVSSPSPAPSVPPASANPTPQPVSSPSPAPSVPPASANPAPQPVSSPSPAPSVPPTETQSVASFQSQNNGNKVYIEDSISGNQTEIVTNTDTSVSSGSKNLFPPGQGNSSSDMSKRELFYLKYSAPEKINEIKETFRRLKLTDDIISEAVHSYHDNTSNIPSFHASDGTEIKDLKHFLKLLNISVFVKKHLNAEKNDFYDWLKPNNSHIAEKINTTDVEKIKREIKKEIIIEDYLQKQEKE